MNRIVQHIAVAAVAIGVILGATGTASAHEEDLCLRAGEPFQGLIAETGVTLVCEEFDEKIRWAGWYTDADSQIHVAPTAGYEETYWRQVVAHELGHAWDFKRLTPETRREIAMIHGFRTPETFTTGEYAWNIEWAADVYAFCLGWYVPYEGTPEWRPGGPKPSWDRCKIMRDKGLLSAYDVADAVNETETT